MRDIQKGYAVMDKSMVELCRYCPNEAEFRVLAENKIANVKTSIIYCICKECYNELRGMPLYPEEIEKLR